MFLQFKIHLGAKVYVQDKTATFNDGKVTCDCCNGLDAILYLLTPPRIDEPKLI
jgi:hypothetical protein